MITAAGATPWQVGAGAGAGMTDASAGSGAEAAPQGEALDAAASLAGAVAHDLGNMLTVVMGNAELLVEELAGRPELAELAALILASAQRGTELTSRLDRFARRIPLGGPQTDMAAALEHFARRIRARLPDGVDFELHVAPGLRPVAVPAVALASALDELAANALAALGGKGCLRVRGFNHATASGQARVRVVVEDEGAGMDAETLTRARQLRFASGIAGHRTALGLPLAMRAVSVGGGGMQIESAPGQGTRITLDLAVDS